MKFSAFFAIFSIIFGCWAAGPLPEPFTEKCIVGLENRYPKTNPDDYHYAPIPWYTIDLDKNPIDRWAEVARDFKQQIIDLIQVIKDLEAPFFHGKLVNWVDEQMGM